MQCAPSIVRHIPLLLGIVLVGCGRQESAPGRPTGAPQRIVCASPAIAEITFAVGAGSRVVGVSDYTSHPAEATSLPKVGGRMNPNRERLLVLEADLILTQGKDERLQQFADIHGIAILSVKLDSLADVFAAIGTLGRAVGHPDEAEALAAALRLGMEAPRDTAVPTLMIMGHQAGGLRGLTAIGPGTFLNDVLIRSGGSNILSDTRALYPQISIETILARRPEVIIELQTGHLPPPIRAALLEDWTSLMSVPAVAAGRIHFITNDCALIAGPRLLHTAALLRTAIQGDGTP